MNIKKHIYEYVRKKTLLEGLISDENKVRPDLKYYAFDWDDNIMFMPTKIMVLTENEEEIGMSTEDFAEHRLQIGQEPFNYKGTTIVGFAPDPFRYFRTEGDKRFMIDSMTAPVGPAWNDFVECINGGSIFAIITARGHNPETLKEAVLNLILANKNGINRKTLEENLNKYSEFDQITEQINTPKGSQLITDYLNKCKFHPVSFGEGSATSPEEGKNKALKSFITYCKEQAKNLLKSILEKNPNMKMTDLIPVFKNDVSMMEPIEDVDQFIDTHLTIGFSDDDERNIKASSEFLNKEFEKSPVNLYLTKGGEKTKYNK
jgi:hypothetical protein